MEDLDSSRVLVVTKSLAGYRVRPVDIFSPDSPLYSTDHKQGRYFHESVLEELAKEFEKNLRDSVRQEELSLHSDSELAQTLAQVRMKNWRESADAVRKRLEELKK